MVKTRFCTSCQATKGVEGGYMKQTRGVPRWVCKGCAEKKYEGVYKNHGRRDGARRDY